MSPHDFTDEELISYLDAHSRTERALVSNAHVRRLLALAQIPWDTMPETLRSAAFICCRYENIFGILSSARANLRRSKLRLVKT
jgi:hypothetical protein